MSLYSIATDGRLQPHLSQEWLLTNGLGGYAFSTVVGCNTRGYHGILCAATLPPVGRVMALNRIGEALYLDGKMDRRLEFSVNQFGERFFPHGEQYLRRFELDDLAQWHYEIEGVRITKQVQILWMKNVTAVRYRIVPDRERRVQLNLQPFVSLRDFHARRSHAKSQFQVRAGERRVAVGEQQLDVHIWSDNGRFEQAPAWWYRHTYLIEIERGSEDTEDLFAPGQFVLETARPAEITLWAAMAESSELDFDAELKRRRDAVGGGGLDRVLRIDLVTPPPVKQTEPSPAVRKLLRAANDFVVYRRAPDGTDGTSILAGYPWFADWGRDTMISLPGLLLVPGRFEQARQVLQVYANYVSEGMIPNRFDDYTNEPHYNTVDASLWFIHAVFQYREISKNEAAFAALKPACEAIINGYRDGTRFNIKMDPADFLITQGDASTQLTWMDAKCGDVAYTPRQGKAVEINALWYNALVLMGEVELAARVAENFRRAFWISPFRGLADVVNEGHRDNTIRPNQIFAAGVPHSPLAEDQQRAVVEVVRRELLTPVGLRTLPKNDPHYHPRYLGPQPQRDEAYHNGTIWPWLIGAFLDAYLRVNQRSAESVAQAQRWLAPLIEHMNYEGCVGQISEIFEADEPFRPVGCPAQAWSVAEVLRLAVDLEM